MLNEKRDGICNSINHVLTLAVPIYYDFPISKVNGKMEIPLIFQELESDSSNPEPHVADIL